MAEYDFVSVVDGVGLCTYLLSGHPSIEKAIFGRPRYKFLHLDFLGCLSKKVIPLTCASFASEILDHEEFGEDSMSGVNKLPPAEELGLMVCTYSYIILD